MNHEAAFSAHFDAHPEDWECRLVYADFLSGIGAEWEAVAQRYMVELGCRPDNIFWCSTEYWEPPNPDIPDLIEQSLYKLLAGFTENPYEHPGVRRYDTTAAAESALCDALRLYHAAMETWKPNSFGDVPRSIRECTPKSHATTYTVREQCDAIHSESFLRPYIIDTHCERCDWHLWSDGDVLRWAQTPDPKSQTFQFLQQHVGVTV